jgi:hypothetical protein
MFPYWVRSHRPVVLSELVGQLVVALGVDKGNTGRRTPPKVTEAQSFQAKKMGMNLARFVWRFVYAAT